MLSALSLRIWLAGQLKIAALVAGVAIAMIFSGCRHVGVRAHQRELSADRIMKLDGNAQEHGSGEHILANREGAIGGSDTAPGEGGCN